MARLQLHLEDPGDVGGEGDLDRCPGHGFEVPVITVDMDLVVDVGEHPDRHLVADVEAEPGLTPPAHGLGVPAATDAHPPGGDNYLTDDTTAADLRHGLAVAPEPERIFTATPPAGGTTVGITLGPKIVLKFTTLLVPRSLD